MNLVEGEVLMVPLFAILVLVRGGMGEGGVVLRGRVVVGLVVLTPDPEGIRAPDGTILVHCNEIVNEQEEGGEEMQSQKKKEKKVKRKRETAPPSEEEGRRKKAGMGRTHTHRDTQLAKGATTMFLFLAHWAPAPPSPPS